MATFDEVVEEYWLKANKYSKLLDSKYRVRKPMPSDYYTQRTSRGNFRKFRQQRMNNLRMNYFIKKKFFNIDCLYRYQLQIEDAEILSHYDTVVFVDATKENTKNGWVVSKALQVALQSLSIRFEPRYVKLPWNFLAQLLGKPTYSSNHPLP